MRRGGLVGTVSWFGDHAVQAGALEPVEPLQRGPPVPRHWGEVYRRADICDHLLQECPALALRGLHPAPPAGRQQVKADERCRRLLRELRHPRRGRMEPHLQRIEIEPMGRRDHDLSVDHTALGQLFEQRLVQLREVTVERPQIAALNEKVRGAAKNNGSEPVPFRLVEKRSLGGQGVGQLGQHRLDRRGDGKCIAHLERM